MPTKTTRKQTPAQARKAALESDFAPLYAVAGLTDLVTAPVRTKLVEAREGADDLMKLVIALPNQLKTVPGQVKTLPAQVKTLPDYARTQLTDVQERIGSLVSGANKTYADLAGRGKLAVDATLKTAKLEAEPAKAARPAAKKAPAKKATTKDS